MAFLTFLCGCWGLSVSTHVPPPPVLRCLCRNGSSCFLCFKGLINHTRGEEEGGQRGISKDRALRFSKLSSLESIMTQLENALSSPHYWSHKNSHHRFANSWSFPGLCHQPIEPPISAVCVCAQKRVCEQSSRYMCFFVQHFALFHLFLSSPHWSTLGQVCVCTCVWSRLPCSCS